MHAIIERMSEKSTNQENNWADMSEHSDEEDDLMDLMPEPGVIKRKRGRIPNVNEESKNRRLELNRLSAKESRKRKKQYMSNLEERNQVLEKEKARLLRKINTLEEERRISFLSHVETADQFVEGR
jgi:hypothetical protein